MLRVFCSNGREKRHYSMSGRNDNIVPIKQGLFKLWEFYKPWTQRETLSPPLLWKQSLSKTRNLVIIGDKCSFSVSFGWRRKLQSYQCNSTTTSITALGSCIIGVKLNPMPPSFTITPSKGQQPHSFKAVSPWDLHPVVSLD
jgi:hypothetical protein